MANNAYGACSVSTTGVNFGVYDPFNPTALNATGIVSIACDVGSIVTISIGQSLHSGLLDPRQMKNTLDNFMLNYNLYTRGGLNAVWGDGTGGTSTVQRRINGNNRPRTFTVFGSLPPGQNVSAGNYTDSLTVTVIW